MCSHQALKVFPVCSPSSQLCSDQVLKVVPESSPNSQLCSDQVLKVFPASSQSVPSMFPKFSKCSQQVLQIRNCVLIKFPKCSHHVPQVPNVFLMTFPIATFIPYKCSLCRVGPSVNTSMAQLHFSFQNPIFEIWVGNKIHSKIQHLSHLSSENCEINSIKSHSPRAFQQNQE
jgi:hypothetical protein